MGGSSASSQGGPNSSRPAEVVTFETSSLPGLYGHALSFWAVWFCCQA